MKKRLYDDRRWKKAAKYYLDSNPLCVMCLSTGHETAANTVDHITPHNGDYALFWDSGNWQALCPTCHGVKRLAENHGHTHAADANGLPLDPGHPWYEVKK